MKIKGLKYLLIFIFSSLLISSCSNADSNNDNEIDDSTEQNESNENNNQSDNNENEPALSDDYEFIPPSPLQIASIFKKAGLDYVQGLPNSVDNADNYNSKFQQSLNFGVYSSDLALYMLSTISGCWTRSLPCSVKNIKSCKDDSSIGLLGLGISQQEVEASDARAHAVLAIC